MSEKSSPSDVRSTTKSGAVNHTNAGEVESSVRRFVAPRPGVRSRIRRRFGSEHWRATGVNILITIPLALLVWFWAYSELIEPSTLFDRPIELRVTGEGQFAKLARGEPTSLRFDVRGPKASVDRLRDRIAKNVAGQVYLSLPADLPPGTHRVPVLELLGGSNLFTDLRLSVQGVNPSTLNIEVDEIVEREIRVEAPAGLTGFKSVVPSIANVRVRGPRGQVDRIERAVMQLDGRPELDRIGSTEPIELQAVSLMPTGEPDAVWVDGTIPRVKLEPTDTTELRYVIPSVVVYGSMPGSFLEERSTRVIITPPTLANVEVTGPATVIAQIRDGTLEPFPEADLRLTREDIETMSSGTRTVRLLLPPGVSLVGPQPTVRFEIAPATSVTPLDIVP